MMYNQSDIVVDGTLSKDTASEPTSLICKLIYFMSNWTKTTQKHQYDNHKKCSISTQKPARLIISVSLVGGAHYG